VDHDAVVPKRPLERRPGSRDLVADESILRGNEIVRERLLVENVTELAIERGPLVVADLQQPFVHPKSIVEIVVQFMLRKLDVPPRKIPPVEHLNPV
jgi:hypothetical protein